MAALRFECVSARFGRRVVLHELTLECPAGRATCIAGPNGAGKSTLLAIAASLLRPSAGRVLLGREDVTFRSPPRSLAYLPQTSAFPAPLTVAEAFEFARRARGAAPEEAADAVRTTGIEAVVDRRVGELSGGWTRRLGLAIALLPGPAALLLDEPFVGLDPETLDRLLAHLRARLRKGTAVAIASHEFELVDELAPAVAVLDEGRLRAAFAAGHEPSRQLYRRALAAPPAATGG